MRTIFGSILSIFALLTVMATAPPELDAQVSDTLSVTGFEQPVSIQRTRCGSQEAREEAVGSTFTCKYVAFDAAGFPTPATWSYASSGGVISVSFSPFPDSAIAVVTVTGVGTRNLIVTAADP